MKLAGPHPGVRLELRRREVHATVTGVFPPERAPEARVVAEQLAIVSEPQLRAAFEESQLRFANEMLYGRPDASEPRGILRGCSPVETMRVITTRDAKVRDRGVIPPRLARRRGQR